MTERDTPEADEQLLFDVVTTLTTNARRVATTALAEARAAGDTDLIGAVSGALATETDAIIAGSDPRNRALVGAVTAAGHAIQSVAVQALRTGIHEPDVALERAFDLFASYLQSPGRSRIVPGAPRDQPSAG